MSQSYAHGGSYHSDGHPIHQAVEVTTGQVDHNVSPHQGEADQGVERHEDDKDSVGRLQLGPQQHCVYIVSGMETLNQNVVILEQLSWYLPHEVHTVDKQTANHHSAQAFHDKMNKSFLSATLCSLLHVVQPAVKAEIRKIIRDSESFNQY